MERKFTIAQLEWRRLNWSDILWLSIFSFLIFWTFYLKNQNDGHYFAFELITSGFCTYLIILSPLGLKFRSVYYSLLWMGMSIVFAFAPHSIAWIPVMDFTLYHVIRLMFWKKYNSEFIPFSVGRGELYRYTSYIENRSGTFADKMFMKLLIWLGVLINFICLYGLIGVKVH